MIEEMSDCEVYEARELLNDEAYEAEYEAKVAAQMKADENRFYENGRVWDSLGLYALDDM